MLLPCSLATHSGARTGTQTVRMQDSAACAWLGGERFVRTGQPCALRGPACRGTRDCVAGTMSLMFDEFGRPYIIIKVRSAAQLVLWGVGRAAGWR